jgi:hypothetical protein
MGGLGDAAGLERQPEGPLQRGAAHRPGGRRGALAAVPLGGKEQPGMPMGFPLLAQELERALGQRDVAVEIAFAGPNVQEHALRIDIAHLQAQAFAQAQAAGVNGGQRDPVIQRDHLRQDAPHLAGREDDRQLALGIGPGQFDLARPDPAQALFPEELEGADGLGAGLAGDLFVDLEVDEVLPEVFGIEAVGGLAVELAELADAGVIGLGRAGAQRQELEVVGEGF